MFMPDKTIICKAVDRPLVDGVEIGGLLTIIRPTDEGSCVIPVKVTAISDKGEIIATTPIGKPQRVQRRVFPRIKIDNNIQMKIQFDRYNSRYKSLKVYDVSGGGVGATIYSKNPIEVGQLARLEMELSNRQNKINAIGKVVHCTMRGSSTSEYLLGFKFVEISELDQQRIIEYVTEEQRKYEEAEKEALERELKEKKTRKEDAKKKTPQKTKSLQKSQKGRKEQKPVLKRIS